MRRRPTSEDGFVLVTAVIVLALMMTIALAMLAFKDGQQRAVSESRVREASFQVADSALNSQVFQLARTWPTAAQPYPLACTAATAALPQCSTPATVEIGDGANGTGVGTGCPPGTPTDRWRTSVHDNGGGTAERYDRAIVDAQPTYDAAGAGAFPDGKLWIRATGVANCRVRTVVALVTQNLVAPPFPRNAITANWFQATNSGNKVMVDTLGNYSAQAGDVVVRCASMTQASCLSYQAAKGQVSPDTARVDAGVPAQTASSSQLESFRNQARGYGRYYPAGTPCGSMDLSGKVVFVEQMPTGCNPAGNNAEALPGFLVIARGRLSLGGNRTFYGVIFFPNLDNDTGAMLSLNGTALVQGAVIVDGPGGVSAGASKLNLVFDPRAFGLILSSAGTGIVKSSWRLLPAGL